MLNIAEPPASPFLLRTAEQGMFINGRRVPSASGDTFSTVNPATGGALAAVAAGDREDVDRAVKAARSTFEDSSWSGMNPHARTRLLLRLADGIEEHVEDLAVLESLDTGIPLTTTRMMMANAAQTYRYYAGWPTKMTGTVNPVDPMVHCYTVRAPIGVCAGIVPWNGPAVMASWKIAPALAAGNTVVIKPAEQTPLTALLLAEIFSEKGLPDGAMNVVTGFGDTAGAAVAEHHDIDKVSFTGSTATGKRVLAASIGNLKRVTLELGGKSPHIILPDADLDVAAATAAAGFCALSGQVCVAGTRILVHESVREEFVEKLSAAMAIYRIGDPFDESTVLGPLISAAQRDRVNSYVTLGLETGLRAAVGGTTLDGPGFYVEPTLFDDVPNNNRVAQEEIFGPVATVISFKDVDDAVRIANDSQYGLAAAVATRDISQAHLISQRLQAGVVWVNTYGELDLTFPFGGFKQSGLGRELGEKSLDNFTEMKSVFVRL